MSYYNTTSEKGIDLKSNTKKAKTQDEIVLYIFKCFKPPLNMPNFKGFKFSPSQVLTLSGLNCPITSIRRSISNLTKKGLLEKTEIKIMGMYGRMEYCWKLK